MENVKIKNNQLDFEVYIEKIDFSLIPISDLFLIISELELDISNMIDKSNKRKKYRK